MSIHKLKARSELLWTLIRKYYVSKRLLHVNPGDTVILQCSDHKVTLLAKQDRRTYPCHDCDMFKGGICRIRAGKRSNDFCRVGYTGVHYKNMDNLMEDI